MSPETPIVAYEPADPSAIPTDAKAFVTAERDGGKLTALRAGVGWDGLTRTLWPTMWPAAVGRRAVIASRRILEACRRSRVAPWIAHRERRLN